MAQSSPAICQSLCGDQDRVYVRAAGHSWGVHTVGEACAAPDVRGASPKPLLLVTQVDEQ